MDLGLEGRTYICTGASRGLGFAVATSLVTDGANVVLSARDGQGLGAAVESLGADHAVGFVSDLAADATADNLIQLALHRFGRIDGALISVGGPPATSALETSDEQWRTAFDTVFLGALRLVRRIVVHLDEAGSIALVLSGSVKSPIPNLAISNGLRPGLAMLVKNLADELGPTGIRINGLLPGRIATDRMIELDADEAAKARNLAAIPLGRYGDPAEFGRAGAFVLSPAASYITGAMIPVDGGAGRAL